MGLENRDYYRDGSYTDTLTGWGVDFTPVVKYLIVANVLVFLLQIFITRSAIPDLSPQLDHELWRRHAAEEENHPNSQNPPQATPDDKDETFQKRRQAMEEMLSQLPGMRVSVVQKWLELDPAKTLQEGQLWRIVTCAFCHNRLSIWHILFNMLMLCWFGTRLERMYGSGEFFLFYIAAAISSSLAYLGLASYSGSNTPAIGASGAVMGVMMLYVIFYPFETFCLFWVIPVPLWVLLGLYVLYDVHPVLLALAGDPLFTGVAHAGHLGGLAFGFFYWKIGWRLDTVCTYLDRKGLRWPRRQRRLSPGPAIASFQGREDLAARVDVVLKKISAQGKDSLTDEERRLLIDASARYRDKK